MSGVWRNIILLTCIIFTNGCGIINSLVVDSRNQIPGSFMVQYGGLQGRIVKESSRYIEREARRWHWDLYQAGTIDIFELNRRQQEISWQIQDARFGGRWSDRRWFESFPPEKGGAPLHPVIHMCGKTYVLLDGGFFTLTNAGDISFKEWAKEFDVKPTEEENDGELSGTTWLVRVRPNASFSFGSFMDDTSKGIKEAGITARFTHFVRHMPMVEITFNGEYDFHREELRVYAQIQLLQW